MSVLISTMVWRTRGLDSTSKLVLARLADFADDAGGSIYPTVCRVAEDCGLSERATRNAFRRLEETGHLILVKNEESGNHKAREYRIDVSKLAGGTTCRAEPDAGGHDVPGGISFQTGGHQMPPNRQITIN